MCRFSAKDSQLYLPVEKAIKGLCNSIIQTRESENSQIASGQPTDSRIQQDGQQVSNSSSAIQPERTVCCQPVNSKEGDYDPFSARAGIIKYPSQGDDRDPLVFMASEYIRHDYGWKSYIQKTLAPQDSHGDSITVDFTGDVQMTLEVSSSLTITDIASLLRTRPEGLFFKESTLQVHSLMSFR
jgi:hypothetical protein